MKGPLFHKAKKLLYGLSALTVLVLAFASPSFAACANPTGVVGNMGYFGDVNLYRYCDGTNWIDVGPRSGDVTSGLVAHWKFDETSGTTGTDIIGGATATLTNGAQFAAGKYNYAAQSTDAVDDYISTSAIDLSGTSAVTIAFWTNRTWSNIGSKTLYEFSDNANLYTDAFGFFPDDTGCNAAGRIYIFHDGDVGHTEKCYNQPTSGIWNHIAVVHDKSQAAANEIELYINGVLQTSTNASSTNNTNNFGNYPFYMFSRGGTLEFNPGYIDDFRVYNRALTAAEIATLAENEDSTGLILHWNLNENTGTTANDSSTTGNTGTLRSGATWTPGYNGSGAIFDGTNDCIDEPAVDLSGTDDITVSAWFKRNWGAGGGGYETLFEGTDNFNPLTTGFAIFPTGDGTGGPGSCPNYKLEVYLKGNVGNNGKCYDPPGDTNWHMLTAVYDKSQAAGSEIAFYIDGVVQTASSQPHNSNNTNNFGNDPFNFFTRNCTSTGAGESVAGTGDEVRIYNRAHTAGEISALIDCTSPAGRKGMVNYDTTDQRYEYCNGTSWIAMDTTCTVGNGGAGCTGGTAGSMRYNTTSDIYEFCEGDTWVCAGNKCDHTPNGIGFDGTDYLSKNTPLTGVSDSNKWTGGFWFKRGNHSLQELLDTDAGSGPTEGDISFHFLNDEARIMAENTSASEVLRIEITSPDINDSTWHHIMWSVDLSTTGRRHVMIDGTLLSEGTGNDQANFVTYNTSGVMDFTPKGAGGVSVGSNTTNTVPYIGDMADFWVDFGSYIDLSIAANRAKFYNSGPVYLGCDGSAPLGYAADIFLSGPTAGWETNDGTGGGFTENGALTDAATDP